MLVLTLVFAARDTLANDPVAAHPRLATAARPITRADGTNPAPEGSEPAERRGVVSPWTLFVTLTVIGGGILVIVRLRRKNGPSGMRGLPAEAVEVLGRRLLDRRQSIHLVRCGTRLLVLGSSDAGLRTLSEITDPAEVDYLAGVCRRSDGEPSFAESLGSFFQKLKSAPAAPARPQPTAQRTKPAAERTPWESRHA